MATFYNPSTGEIEESKINPRVANFRRTIFRSQRRFSNAGINVEPPKKSSFDLAKLLEILGRSEGASATVVGDLLKYGTLPSLGELGQIVTGKKQYDYGKLLSDLGMEKGLGRSALAFGLGTFLDPLTYLPLGKVAGLTGRVVSPIADVGMRVGEKIPVVSSILDKTAELAKWGKRAFGVKKESNAALQELNDLLKGSSGRVGYKGLETAEKYRPLLESLGRLNDEEKSLVSFAVENKSLRSKLSKPAQETLDLVSRMFKETGKEKAKRGLVKGLIGEAKKEPVQLSLFKTQSPQDITEYLSHMVTEDFYKKVIEKRATGQPGEATQLLKGLIRTNLPRVEKSRNVLASIYKLNQAAEKKYGVKMFEEDITKIIPKYLVSYSQNVALHDLAMDMLKITDETGKPLIRAVEKKVPKGLVKLKAMPFGGKFATTPEVAKEVNRVAGVLSSDVMMNKFAKAFDKMMKYWKASVTIPWPSFNLMNLLGASFNNFVEDPGSLSKVTKAIELISGKPMMVVAKDGSKMTGKQFMDELVKRGALLTYAGFDVGGKSFFSPKRMVDKLWKGVGRVSSGVEKLVRTQLALDVYEKTGSMDKAIRAVWKVHGNYAPEALSTFERNYLRRIVPFYVWAKTNIPFQLQGLWNKTGRYAMLARAEREIAPKRENMPEWLRNKVVVDAKKIGADKEAVTTLDLPVNDIFRLSPTKFVSSVLNPFARLAIELTANKSFFTGRPIVNEKLPREYQTAKAYDSLALLPKPLQSWLKLKKVKYKNSYTKKFETRYEADAKRLYLMLNLIGPLSRWYYTTRAGQRMEESLGENIGPSQKIATQIYSFLSPLKIYTYSPGETQYWNAKNKENQMREITSYLLKRGLIKPKR